jgi:NADH:ubiquinone oxidoreductase subunit 5 (subunit L)/multisubunit Na+/H+ antiporter MnhA subunit/multisubunit Na+/H+ antiporter MnhB subunit
MEALLLTAVFSPLVGAPLVALAGRALGRRTVWVALALSAVSTGCIVGLTMGAEGFTARTVSIPWIPALGLGLDFLVDGLSLFFGLVVSGMGILVALYAAGYLDDRYRDHGRFYAYLALFMAAMLGTVFANNLLLLFVFWELTGVASFLLIGFLHGDEKSRVGARQALLITGATGLVLMVGLVLTGVESGTWRISELLAGGRLDAASGAATAAFLLVVVGAFGKSAQFPFHFWLPNAMTAPTPVSAYLHSATMVKLGVFLIARLFPVFRDVECWTPVLVSVGFTTLVIGSWLALSSTDLKAILAYSTVSQLGFLIGFYGIGSRDGVHYDLMHIANHVFYKGCLFMVAGIVDHCTGTRDVREIQGLGRRAPLLAGIALVAAATMAGLPGTIGFVSKEYMLKEKFDYWGGDEFLNWYPLIAVAVASALKVAFCLRLWLDVYPGRMSPAVERDFHAPGLLMQIPPLVLATACLVFGIAPGLMTPALETLAVSGLHLPDVKALHLWHGVTREFLLSAGIVAAGGVLFGVLWATDWRWARVPAWLRFDRAFEAGVTALPKLAKRLNLVLRVDRPLDHLPILLGFVVIVTGAALWRGGLVNAFLDAAGTATVHPLRAFVGVLIVVAMGLVLTLPRWSGQLIALSIVGFLVTFMFVLFRAPDLALTQILIEAATLILVLLLLARFPRSVEADEQRRTAGPARRWLNITLAVSFGLVVTILSFSVVAQRHPDFAGRLHLEASLPLAKGSNAVNTILIDFRGFDTMLEITVLAIATLGVLGLLTRNRRPAGLTHRLPGEAGLSDDEPPGGGNATADKATARESVSPRMSALTGDRSPIFRAVATLLFFLINIFALYLLWRGHNLPGGGFIAGVGTGMSFILLALAFGVERAQQVLRVDPVRIAAAGLIVAFATASAPLLLGAPFLKHWNWKLTDLPVIGNLAIGTPLFFDIGVFLVVIGVTCKLVFVLARAIDGVGALTPAEMPRYTSSVEEPIEAPVAVRGAEKGRGGDRVA